MKHGVSSFHIIHAGIDNGDWAWIERASVRTVSPRWTVPKNARPGDHVAIYVQTKGIVATAAIVDEPKLRRGWTNRYGAKLTGIRRLHEPITLDDLRLTVPAFNWIRYPRSITTPPSEVSAALQRLIDRRGADRAPKTIALPTDARDARKSLEAWFPDVNVRRAVLSLLAETLRVAGGVTTAWSVTLQQGSVRLNVGPVRLMTLSRDSVWFCATGVRRSNLPTGWADVSRGPIVYPRSVSTPSRQYSVAPEAVPAMPRRLKDALFEYVRMAGTRKNGLSAWHSAHSGEVLSYVESFLGIDLPRPAGPRHLGAGAQLLPDEISAEESYREGARIRVGVNAYERSNEARDACLAAWGTRCAVCEFDFGARYGAFAEGFIHVHHLTPLSTIGDEYEINPVADLRPVCPNCHAAIHIGGECRSIEEMRRMILRRR